MERIILNPVGKVLSEIGDPNNMPMGGMNAVVEIYPEFADALQGIEEN